MEDDYNYEEEEEERREKFWKEVKERVSRMDGAYRINGREDEEYQGSGRGGGMITLNDWISLIRSRLEKNLKIHEKFQLSTEESGGTGRLLSKPSNGW
mmetsp:Transcript_58153/g.142178  ORF Transcript_58153/g.142178 Transcript_58153/m.142178 type:complete len:98 (+) Transcript_58153:80-373(+)